MKLLPALLAAACLIGTGIAHAVADDAGLLPGTFSGGVTLASEYRFRGLSQTAQKPAIQGSIDYALETGFQDTSVYLGAWGSNVDFDDGGEATMELDLYGGFKGKLYGFTWLLGATGYLYPGAAASLNYDLVEINGSLAYDIASWLNLGILYAHSPNFFGDTGIGNYVAANVAIALPLPAFLSTRGVSASLQGLVGQQWVADNALLGIPDWLNWSVGARINYRMVSLGVAYVDTDIAKSRCFPNAATAPGGRGWCGPAVVGTLSASF